MVSTIRLEAPSDPSSAGRPQPLLLIGLGSVLLLSAALKGYQFVSHPAPGKDLFSSWWFQLAVVEIELTLGLLLLTGLLPLLVRYTALFLFTAFAGAASYKAFSGYSSCGCFGMVPVNPWLVLAFDLSAIVVLALSQPSQAHLLVPLSVCGRLLALAVFVSITSSVATLFLLTPNPATVNNDGDLIGSGSVVVLEPERWLGKRFPLLKHIDIGRELSKGEWIVILYHRDCPKCQQVVSAYRTRWLGHAVSPRLALVEVPTLKHYDPEPAPADFSYLCGRLHDEKEWFVELPLRIDLIDSEVSSVRSANNVQP